MEQKRTYNLRPLPGGRRGLSETGDGCHSMRLTGGEGRTRRAPVAQNAIAGHRGLNRRAPDTKSTAETLTDDTISLFSSIPSTRPSYMTRRASTLSSCSTLDSVVREVNLDCVRAPTSSISNKRRRWTSEMNEFILRTYFELTALDTDISTYLEPLHLNFIEKFPTMQVSRQRVGDQRRAIIRRNLLPQSTIDQIYKEVQEKLNISQMNCNTQQTTVQPQSQASETYQTQTRLRWTKKHNETIMRLYYQITQLETNLTNYRKPLHETFINTFPSHAHVSEQRVADQRRAIIHNKYISDKRLIEIKQQVAENLQQNTSNIHICDPTNTSHNIHDNNTNGVTSLNMTEFGFQDDSPSNQHYVLGSERDPVIDDTYYQTFQFFKNTDPKSRTYIPKQKPSRKFAKIVNYLNEVILPENVNIETDFTTLQTVIYCSAWTAAKVNGAKMSLGPSERSHHHQRDRKPHWQRRLERKIDDLRVKIGRLTHFINGNRSEKLEQFVKCIMDQYKIHSVHEEHNRQLSHTLDTLKQKLLVITGRLRRYKSCTLRKKQNNQFINNEKQFYRNIKQETVNVQQSLHNTNDTDESPDSTDLRDFWAGIWEQPTQHNNHADWIASETTHNSRTTQEMTFEHIPVDIFLKVLRSQHNWRCPGSDYIHCFWYKKFTKIHGYLHNYINIFIQEPSTVPTYLTHGTTYMIPKDHNDLKNPAKYRPIACLQTIYKIITSCISELIYQHIDKYEILAEQQKGCRRFSQGCKEQLIIDSVILKHVQITKSNLFTMYIDYKKAYDSVPHSWLTKVLEIYKIHPTIITFLKVMMMNWTTQIKVTTPTKTIETDLIRIQRGIFQGDALSPLWFCLALNPLSSILNATELGYPLLHNDTNTDRLENISHLLYMDDIKLYANSENNLYQLANLTEKFTNDIKMELGIDKCKINSVTTGHQYQHHYTLETGERIDALNELETYKYLGYNQSLLIQYKQTKQNLKQQFQHRLNSILKTQLNARNTVKAVNSYAIPILSYSFGIINWTKTELKDIQRKINTTMTKFRKHHPRSCFERLTLKRKEGGRGIIDVTNLHNRQIITLRQYFFNKTKSSSLHKAIVQNDIKLTPLNLHDNTSQNNEKIIDDNTKIAEWAGKSLHGRHHNDLCQSNVDKEASNAWLQRGDLFPETEGFMMAIQDQIIETKNYQKHIIKTLSSDLCRKCNSSPETIQHITGACKSIAQTDYKHRHDQVANIIHQKLAFKQNLVTSVQPYYKYIPEIVLENSTTKLYFDRAILTDRTIHYNRPDITLINKTNKTAFLIDIAVPNTHNLQNTISEKLTKYTELKEEITRLWKLQKVTIVPIVLSATGVIPKQLHLSLKTLNLPPNTFHLMQKAVILNTCRIVRKFLQTEQDHSQSHSRRTTSYINT